MKISLPLDNVKLAELLIQHGADVNLTNYESKTALHMAVSKGIFCSIELKSIDILASWDISTYVSEKY